MIPVLFLYLVSALSGLGAERENPDRIYFLKLDKKDYSRYDCRKFKYITKLNIHEIDRSAVKNLHYDGINNKELPAVIRKFRNVEKLDLSTDWIGMKVRWPGGMDEWVGFHKKSKLKKIPDWLSELSHIESLNLNGHKKLSVESVTNTLAKLGKLKTLTLEIEEKGIDNLDALVKLKKLNKLTIYMENMTRDNELTINAKLQHIVHVAVDLKPFARFERSKCFR